jgi:23S rRNA pseudouridine1911/1915/1917 synthase
VILYPVDRLSYRIEYSDRWLIVAFKPPGLPCQPGRGRDTSLLDLLAAAIDGPLHVVHRIDQRASGLVLYAVGRDAAGALSDLFKRGEVQRKYWAVVSEEPHPPAGHLRHFLRHDARINRSRAVPHGGAQADLSYRTAAKSDRYWLLDIELQTGRHHQIRAQLAAAGWPIRGDLKYGARRSVRGGGIGLHARYLGFKHPYTGTEISVRSSPPDDPLWVALTAGLMRDDEDRLV